MEPYLIQQISRNTEVNNYVENDYMARSRDQVREVQAILQCFMVISDKFS